MTTAPAPGGPAAAGDGVDIPLADLTADLAVDPAGRDWARDTEAAHRYATTAASEGLQDSGLGPLRLAGPGVPVLAEAAVSSATPFLRAPLLTRIADGLALHLPGPDALGAPGAGECPTCRTPHPCATVRALRG